MGRYYYARGQRIAIAADARHVAIERGRAQAAGLGAQVDALGSRRLPDEVLLAERGACDPALLAALRLAGAVQPVYRRAEALLVPLPQVRVELDHAGEREAVMRALASAPHAVDVSEPVANWLLLTPRSGSGDDAIDVANYLHETAHPAAASVRFLQVVPKPLPSR